MPETQSVLADDLVRIHIVMSRALEVTAQRCAAFARDGFPDTATREGFAAYVRCLAAMLHAHHHTEDEEMFPYFRGTMSGEALDLLETQHGQMDPLIDEMEAARQQIARPDPPPGALADLNRAATQLRDLWAEHIHHEECQFSADRLSALLDPREEARLARSIGNHSARLQMKTVPPSLLVPFLLGNLTGKDRAAMSRLVPWIVTRVLVPVFWKNRWKAMSPFLI